MYDTYPQEEVGKTVILKVERTIKHITWSQMFTNQHRFSKEEIFLKYTF